MNHSSPPNSTNGEYLGYQHITSPIIVALIFYLNFVLTVSKYSHICDKFLVMEAQVSVFVGGSGLGGYGTYVILKLNRVWRLWCVMLCQYCYLHDLAHE